MNLKDLVARFQTPLLVLGLLAQVAGYYTSFSDMRTDPIAALLVVGVGYFFIAVYCYIRIVSRVQPESLIHLPSHHESRTVYLYTRRQRIAAATLLTFATLTCFLFFWGKVKGAEHGRMVEEAAVDRRTSVRPRPPGEERPALLSMIEIYDAGWTGSGAFAILESEETLPLAQIVPRPATNSVTFYGTSCAVRLKMEAKESYPWVSVDRIVGEVISFEPLPKYEPVLPAPFQDAEVFYLELSPSRVGRAPFDAEILPSTESQPVTPGFLKLEAGEPEEIIILVNATSPGIYTFSISLHVSSRSEYETVVLVPSSTWLFDGR